MQICKQCGEKKAFGDFGWYRRNERRRVTCNQCLKVNRAQQDRPAKPYVNPRKVEEEQRKAEADVMNQFITGKW